MTTTSPEDKKKATPSRQSPPQEAGVRDIIIAFGSSMVSALNGVPRPDDVTLDDVMATISAAVDGMIPPWEDKAYYTKYPVLWKPVAPESNAEHYAAGYNQAVEEMQRRRKVAGL